MFVDILMAFVIALILEMCALMGKHFKNAIIIASCITMVFIYFIRNCQIDFIGEIDLAIWIIFVILFDMMITIIGRIWKKCMKN